MDVLKKHWTALTLLVSGILLVGTPLHAVLATFLLDGLALREFWVVALGVMAWKELLMAFLFASALCLGSWKKNPFFWILLAYVGWGVFLTFLYHWGEGDFWARLLYGARTEFSFLLLLFAWDALWPLWSQARKDLLLKVALGTGFFVMAFGLILLLTGHEWLTVLGFRNDWSTFYLGQAPAYCQKEGGTDICRLQSTFADANRFAGYLLSLALLIWMSLKKPLLKWGLLLLLALLLWRSFSLSAYLAFAVMIALFFAQALIFTREGSLRAQTWWLLGACAGMALILYSQMDLQSLSNIEHLSRMKEALNSFFVHPFGQGLAVSGPANYKLGGNFIPESWWLQVLVNLGFPGLLLFIAAWLSLFYGKKMHSLFLPLLSTLLFQNLFLHTLEDPGVFVLWVFLLVHLKSLHVQRLEAFSGVVVHGSGRGHGLGIPTINLSAKTLPVWEQGVYLVQVQQADQTHFGVMNWGSRPTFKEEKSVVEVHLLDFKGELYGEKITVLPLEKLRNVQKFDSKEALVKQIKSDIATAQAILLNRTTS